MSVLQVLRNVSLPRIGHASPASDPAPLEVTRPHPDRLDEERMVCPVLDAAAAAGRIDPHDETVGHLARTLEELGLSTPLAWNVALLGPGGNQPGELLGNIFHGRFDPSGLGEGPIKHPSDSMVLSSGHFDEGRFEALVSHAQDGKMNTRSFGDAIAANTRRDGSNPAAYLKGLPFSLVEFSALLACFGQPDPVTGELSIGSGALRDLYQHRQLPPPSGVANQGTLNRVLLRMAGDVKRALGTPPETQLRGNFSETESGPAAVGSVKSVPSATRPGLTLDGFENHLAGVALRDGMQPVDGKLALHYVEAGPTDGPPVVLLHGFPEFWQAWREQIPVLARQGHRVIVPDMRGYNISDGPDSVEGYRPERVAEDISVLLRSLAPGRRAAVIGHDWGANIAWQMAMQHPEQVERLGTMAAGHPADYDLKKMGFEQLMKSWYIGLMSLPRVPEALVRANDFGLFRQSFDKQGVPPEVSARMLDNLRAHPETLSRMINYYRAVAKAKTTDFPRVEVPVLAIHGESDRETGTRLMTTSAEHAPDFRLEQIPGGHWLEMAPETSARVTELISGFLGAPAARR